VGGLGDKDLRVGALGLEGRVPKQQVVKTYQCLANRVAVAQYCPTVCQGGCVDSWQQTRAHRTRSTGRKHERVESVQLAENTSMQNPANWQKTRVCRTHSTSRKGRRAEPGKRAKNASVQNPANGQKTRVCKAHSTGGKRERTEPTQPVENASVWNPLNQQKKRVYRTSGKHK
jgi:hypothetical protein